MTETDAKKPDKITRTTLDNKLVLLHQYADTPPVVTIRLFLAAGSGLDPEGREGLAYLTANLLTARTSNKFHREFNRFKSQYGLTIGSSVYPDFTVFSFTCIEEHRENLLRTVKNLFSLSSVETDLFEQIKNKQLSSLASRRDQIRRVAIDRGLEGFYGEHPYRHPPIGRPEAVEDLTLDDAKTFFNKFFSLDEAIVSAVGTLTGSELSDAFEPLTLPSESATRPSGSPPSPDNDR
ncbi:MAG: M16 family metallopeptidase, partial [bacterium]